jgi:hypothetical protein
MRSVNVWDMTDNLDLEDVESCLDDYLEFILGGTNNMIAVN